MLREARETERTSVLSVYRDAPLAYVFLKRKQILQTRPRVCNDFNKWPKSG